jgi:hypothetical protein
MKRLLILVAQNGFEPVIPDQPVDFSQVTDSYAWVRGHWVTVDPADKKGAFDGVEKVARWRWFELPA